MAINVGLILLLMSLGILPVPASKNTKGFVVDLIRASSSPSQRSASHRQQQVVEQKPVPKPPPIILPVKPTIAPPHPRPKNSVLPMSKDEMAASDISKLATAGGGSAGDSEEVGRGPNGQILYAAQWAREPTNAELNGYLPRNSPEGFGLVACKTIPVRPRRGLRRARPDARDPPRVGVAAGGLAVPRPSPAQRRARIDRSMGADPDRLLSKRLTRSGLIASLATAQPGQAPASRHRSGSRSRSQHCRRCPRSGWG